MRLFNTTLFLTGLSSGNIVLFSKQMNTVDVKIEQTSHTVFQQYGSHGGVLYTVKYVQSTLVVSWYKIQSNRNMENITNEANLNSWKRTQSGGKPGKTRLMSILRNCGRAMS